MFQSQLSFKLPVISRSRRGIRLIRALLPVLNPNINPFSLAFLRLFSDINGFYAEIRLVGFHLMIMIIINESLLLANDII